MKKVYESFGELADCMCSGEGLLHLYNCPQNDQEGSCISWQEGVRDFGEWLDHIGLKAVISDKAEDFYEFIGKKISERSSTTKKTLEDIAEEKIIGKNQDMLNNMLREANWVEDNDVEGMTVHLPSNYQSALTYLLKQQFKRIF